MAKIEASLMGHKAYLSMTVPFLNQNNYAANVLRSGLVKTAWLMKFEQGRILMVGQSKIWSYCRVVPHGVQPPAARASLQDMRDLARRWVWCEGDRSVSCLWPDIILPIEEYKARKKELFCQMGEYILVAEEIQYTCNIVFGVWRLQLCVLLPT